MIIYLGCKKNTDYSDFYQCLFSNGYRFENTAEYEIPLMVGIRIDTNKKTITSCSGTIMACYCSSYGKPKYIDDVFIQGGDHNGVPTSTNFFSRLKDIYDELSPEEQDYINK